MTTVFGAELPGCPVCGARLVSAWRNKPAGGITYQIWQCRECRSAFMNPRPTRDWLKEIYHRSGHGLAAPVSTESVLAREVRFPNSTLDAARLIRVSSRLLRPSDKPRALDIGSGYGFYTAAARRAGYDVTALNPGAWENDVFEGINGFRPLNCFFEEANLRPGSFDLVILSQVLEHVEEPQAFLRRIREILKSSGVVAIAVPNVNSLFARALGVKDNACFWVPEHLNYFSVRGLSLALKRGGLLPRIHCLVSRLRPDAVSQRLRLRGAAMALTDSCVKWLQKPVFGIADRIGLGQHINMWAVAGPDRA